jgi:signal transduction histidine kinase
MRPVDVSRVISDAAALLDRSIDKRIRIVIDNHAPNATIMGDASQIHNALLNMGINAAHAMPDGGQLTFTTTNILLDDKVCACMPLHPVPGSYLEVEVRDTGCGIPLEVINRIFEPFYTTREPGEGTGLGLAAVYGIVQEHKGSIKVYSEVGRGTVFNVYLPLAGDAAAECTEGTVETGTGLILLVDDEEIIRHTSAAMLEKMAIRCWLPKTVQREWPCSGSVPLTLIW